MCGALFIKYLSCLKIWHSSCGTTHKGRQLPSSSAYELLRGIWLATVGLDKWPKATNWTQTEVGSQPQITKPLKKNCCKERTYPLMWLSDSDTDQFPFNQSPSDQVTKIMSQIHAPSVDSSTKLFYNPELSTHTPSEFLAQLLSFPLHPWKEEKIPFSLSCPC